MGVEELVFPFVTDSFGTGTGFHIEVVPTIDSRCSGDILYFNQ